MSFRSFLIVMSTATLIAWIGWIIVLNTIDPTRSGVLGFFLFYLSLGTAMIGTLTVAGVLARLWMKREDLIVIMAMRSFRHALLLTFLFLGSLVFLGFDLFRWWIVLGIILIVSLVELIFVTNKKRSA